MGKLIIENRTDLPMSQALEYVDVVIKKGRVSKCRGGTTYCYVTTFERRGMTVYVSSHKNKKSDRIVISMREKGATK